MAGLAFTHRDLKLLGKTVFRLGLAANYDMGRLRPGLIFRSLWGWLMSGCRPESIMSGRQPDTPDSQDSGN